jgi:hypothetical protein
VALAAEIGVVHLDAAIERLLVVAFHHHLRELVVDHPGGVVGDAKPTRQLEARDALLGLRHQVHGAEPDLQPELGRGEDGARDQRRLRPAGITLIEFATFLANDTVLAAAERRTRETIRPAPRQQLRLALVLGAIESSVP